MELNQQMVIDMAKAIAGKQAMQSPSIGALAKALAAAQAELQPATKNSQNPFLKNKYADITAVYTAIRSVLPAHGLAVVQTMIPAEKGFVAVRTTLLHESGEWIAGEIAMPCQSDKGGIGPQQVGSAITYARRYSLSAIVGVVSEDDDDAEAAQKSHRQQVQQTRQQAKANNPNPMTPDQLKALMTALSKKHGDNRKAYLQEMSDFVQRPLTSCNDLTKDEVSQYLEAVNANNNEYAEAI